MIFVHEKLSLQDGQHFEFINFIIESCNLYM